MKNFTSYSSRVIESATWSDVIVRYICGDELHPDHDTICEFRRSNRKLFERAFTEVLIMASQIGGPKRVGNVSIDGTKIKANASKHSAVSYKRTGEQIAMLQREVKTLTAKAEAADSRPLDDGLTIPKEIAKRKNRIESLKQEWKLIEARYEKEREDKQAEYEEKKKREAQRASGKKPRGNEPKPPAENPPDNMQSNFTDPESRIMKFGNGHHFEQAYNAQAAVDTETYLIVGQLITDAPNDKEQLNPVLETIPGEIMTPANVLADTGYFSEAAVLQAKAQHSCRVHCAIEKTGHHRTVADLEKQTAVLNAPPADATMKEQMKYCLKTREGKALYNLRKQTVEPVFGIIKEVIGFRRFSMRGKANAELVWTLVCLSYNLKKLFVLQNTCA